MLILGSPCPVSTSPGMSLGSGGSAVTAGPPALLESPEPLQRYMCPNPAPEPDFTDWSSLGDSKVLPRLRTSTWEEKAKKSPLQHSLRLQSKVLELQRASVNRHDKCRVGFSRAGVGSETLLFSQAPYGTDAAGPRTRL